MLIALTFQEAPYCPYHRLGLQLCLNLLQKSLARFSCLLVTPGSRSDDSNKFSELMINGVMVALKGDVGFPLTTAIVPRCLRPSLLFGNINEDTESFPGIC